MTNYKREEILNRTEKTAKISPASKGSGFENIITKEKQRDDEGNSKHTHTS